MLLILLHFIRRSCFLTNCCYYSGGFASIAIYGSFFFCSALFQEQHILKRLLITLHFLCSCAQNTRVAQLSRRKSKSHLIAIVVTIEYHLPIWRLFMLTYCGFQKTQTIPPTDILFTYEILPQLFSKSISFVIKSSFKRVIIINTLRSVAPRLSFSCLYMQSLID